MKVAVVGGTGQLGNPLVAELASRSDEVRVLSRGTPRKLPDGASHRRVDLTSGEGLDEALTDVEVVIDASNSSPRDAGPVQVEGTKRLLRAGREAGVRHHVGISIVGCDRVPIPYYKVKVEHEQAIAAGGVSWSLLRASQFHTLIAWAYAQAGRFRVVPTGKARLQPIDPRLVAERLADVAHDEPAGRLPDMAGPQVETLSELATAWRRVGHRGASLRLPMIGRIGRPVREGALCDPAAAAGGPTFEEWLARG
jgi:uncharacterized protein YbjT (DUF2867 family)